ncbi:MAG TPA: helix-turn-helix domain-containing protein [Solirubrobacterales bacterium]|nr:helix-turn-helix domain-containing protein [Solirubrobacterales bacterium]
MGGEVPAGRVLRHESDGDSWEFSFGRPAPYLRGHINSYCSYTERTSTFVRRRELPSDRVTMIINLGEPIRVRITEEESGWSEQAAGFVSGLSDRYALTETGGSQRGIEVNLTPIGAHLMFGFPMHELSNRVVTLEQMFGWRAELFRERVAEAPCASARFGLLDRFFGSRLEDARSPVPSVTRALGRLKQSGGTIPIEALATEIGCSRRHLALGFKEQIGLSPKLLGRILRFERAVSLIDSARPVGWAEMARSCGYFDQAHLIRDFKQFSGSPPEEFARRRLPDGGGVIGD